MRSRALLSLVAGSLLCSLIGCGDDAAAGGGTAGSGPGAGGDGGTGTGGDGGTGTGGDGGTGSGGSGGAGTGGDGGTGTGGDGGTGSGGVGGAGGSGAGGTGGGGGAGGTGGGGIPGAWCTPIPRCDTPPPDPGPVIDFDNFSSSLVVLSGAANHRGRDLFLEEGAEQWVIGKFSYGLIDKDLKDEQVDAWLDRGCTGAWELLGSGRTTLDTTHPTIEGVDDSGGRLYLQIPAGIALAPGRHRVHLVVRGDLTSTDLFLEVVPRGAPIFVTDVDGTLTGTETEEFTAMLTGALPTVHPDAANVLGILAGKGYHPMYMTARPEWLVERTREFLAVDGFPPGIVHTTLSLTGATGNSAVTYKTDELAMLAAKGLGPAWAFGNTASDADAYDAGGIDPLAHRIFYQYDDTHGGRRIEAYSELLAEVNALPDLCH